ncbi:MAG: hypothetical protein QOK35_2996, partial [Pseudonocardiales bacterium]|nr:hypothetical protein [Pseudonocardiales bacterium]
FIEPDAERRRRVLPWFFGAAVRLGRRNGRCDQVPGAAAIWLSPGRTELGPAAFVRSGLVLAPLRFGPAAFRRFVTLTSAFEKAGAAVHGDAPFWHLFILGVDPPEQGAGLGGRLIAPVLAEADAGGLPCYLETLAERNLSFYRRHGFALVSHRREPGLPPFWAMLRAPRDPAVAR